MTVDLLEPIHFCSPSRIVFGPGVRRELPALLRHLGLMSAVLVTDRFFAAPGRPGAELADALLKAGIQCAVFDACQPDPSLALCDAATGALSGHARPQCVLALGGGSNIDLAKVLTLTLVSGAPAASYVGIPSLPHAPLPLIALPTTSGTASELTPGAILVAGDGQTKVAVMDNQLRAQLAVIDPELSVSCPPRVTADAGVDALAHAIESYITLDASRFDREGQPDPGYSGRNPLTLMFARESIRLCFAHLQKAYAEPDHMTARSGMALASLYAGLSYGSAGLHGVHALAYGLAALTHETHGTTNAAVLPYVMAELAHERMDDLCEIARMAGVYSDSAPTPAGALAAAQHVRSLIASVGLPTELRRMGLNRDQLPGLVEAGLGVRRLTKAFPATNAPARYAAIVQAAFLGRLPGEAPRHA
ncbi:iron-containing alcohol dehydrogenase [Ramlibacter sp. 2FC]|uniref:iron-containing alcohol dehydrogenase n=1 Tax=Ramlibacter sp. 2FC TaxID=2502188 RepID=UPI0010F5F5CA|nr:iron-containing alcohol dehydrogenase [Ramlibacter sp. 2FC]